MSNEQRTPLSRTLPLVGQRAALAEIEQHGLALPCHVTAVNGPIVTVAFDVESAAPVPSCEMPIAESEYVRLPIQVGAKGIAVPASVDISIATGLGTAGLPDITELPANLSALMFVPVANANWTATPNADATVIYGAGGGVILQDKAGASPDFSITLNSSGITMTGGGHTLVINSSGISIDSVLFAKHQHAASTPGGGTLVAPGGGGTVTGNTGEVSGDGP